MKRIGIYGGSFNPIHFGHKGIAKWVVENTFVDEVWLMVSPNNPLKDSKILAPEQERLEQARDYVKDLDNVIVSDFEFNLPRPSYMAMTLKELTKTYPDYEFVLIIGADNISTFNKWKNYEYILKNYRVLVYPRKYEEDYSILVSPDSNENWVDICGYDELYLWDAPRFDISSTEIRNKNKNNKNMTKTDEYLQFAEEVFQKVLNDPKQKEWFDNLDDVNKAKVELLGKAIAMRVKTDLSLKLEPIEIENGPKPVFGWYD